MYLNDVSVSFARFRRNVELSGFDRAGKLVFAGRWQLLAGVHDRPGRAPRWEVGGDAANGLYYCLLYTSAAAGE